MNITIIMFCFYIAAKEKERLTFSVDMSDDDFISFLKIKGVKDADCSKLTGIYKCFSMFSIPRVRQ